MGARMTPDEAAAFTAWSASMLSMCEAAWKRAGVTARVFVGGGRALAEVRNETGTITRRDELGATQLELFSAVHVTPEAPQPSPAAESDTTEPEVVNGLRVGHVIVLEGDEVEVMAVDHEGFTWCTVDQGPERDEGSVEWADVKQVTGRVWKARRVDDGPELARVEEPEPEVSKAGLHRLLKEPGADRHTRHSQQVAVYQHEGVWKVLARAAKEKAPEWDVRIANLRSDATVTRIRAYNRAQKCTWDSLDGGAP